VPECDAPTNGQKGVLQALAPLPAARADRGVGARRAQLPLEGRRDDQVARVRLVDGAVARADQRPSEPVTHQVEHMLHAGQAVGRQTPSS
jgi:hypothetical protein